MLLVVGTRLLKTGAADEDGEVRATSRRDNARLVIGVAAAVGFTAGLLANGGGFLLVPLFIVFFGLAVPEATGTSLTVASPSPSPPSSPICSWAMWPGP